MKNPTSTTSSSQQQQQQQQQQKQPDEPQKQQQQPQQQQQHISPPNKECVFPDFCLLCIDDCLMSKFDSNLSPQETQRQYIQTLCFLENLFLEYSHHFKIPCIVTSQFPLTNMGNSTTSRIVRALQANIDVFVMFKSNLRDLRNFLRSFATSEEFQQLKRLAIEVLEEDQVDDPGDTRYFKNSICFSFNNATSINYRIRTNLFNLDNPQLRPFLPQTIICLKKDGLLGTQSPHASASSSRRK